MGGSSFDYSPATTTMCMDSGSGGRGRRGKTSKHHQQASSSSEHGGKPAATKQPQRGLGVAQLEKIRLHNQMMAAYRSAAAHLHDHDRPCPPHEDLHRDAVSRAHFDFAVAAAPSAAGGSSSFQPYHQLTISRFSEETTDRGGARYYDDLLPYRAQPTPSLYAHDARDSSGHRLGQPPAPPPPQQHYWIMSGRSHDGSSADELDLELRL